MQKWSIIIVAALIAAWSVVDTVREFSNNQTIEYYSSAPHRLFYVAAITLVVGVAAFVFARLSPRSRRHVRVFAWGAVASTLTAFVGYFALCIASLSSLFIELNGIAWLVLPLLLSSVFAAYLWFEFYRALKERVSP